MGLFDFLKKKKLTQSSAKELNAPNSQGIQSKESAPPFMKKEVVAKTPLVEISVEQDGPLPLSTLLKTATPSKQGLYPHEIMMLEYAPHFKTTHNNFQNFWYWQYSVTEPQAILDSLFERGFTEVGDLRSALGQFTRNYTQTVKRAADNKRRYAPGWVHSTCLLRGFPKGAAPHLAHDFAEQSVVCYTLCRRCPENTVAAGEGKGI